MDSNQLEFHTISVSYSNEFPHFSDKLFYLQFSPRIGEFPIFSMLVFIMRDGLDVLEKGYFYPGFFYELEYPFIGNYFELLVATVLRNHSINLRVQFNEKANFKHFEIRYGEFVSKEKMEWGKANYLLLTAVRYSRAVHLYVRTRIDMGTATLDGRTDGVTLDEPGYLWCRGTRGYPQRRVVIEGADRYSVLSATYDSVANEHRIKAMFSLDDHRSRFRCSTGDAVAEYEIRVFHHPTQLRLDPAYYSTVPNGSSVFCIADNGYPDPRIEWRFIQGPPNHDWYFNIFQAQLFILPNAPIDSAWSFSCVADNVIPSSRANSTSLLFQFSVVRE